MRTAQVSVRNAGWLIVQRAASAASGLLFALTVPRLMGPDLYGRYALMLSVILWFTLAGGLGFMSIAARFVPELLAGGRTSELRRFLSAFMGLRLVTGLMGAAALAAFCFTCLPEFGRAAVLAAAAAVILRGVANQFYSFFLGLNWAARWGMGQVLRGWVVLVFVAGGAWLGGLTGACLGLAAAEVAVLAVALAWAGDYAERPRLDAGAVRPYLFFGLTFFGVETVYAAFRYSGGLLLRALSGEYAEVAHFSLAVEMVDVAGLVFPQVALSLAPLMTTLWMAQRPRDVAEWMTRLSAGLGALGMACALAAALAGGAVIPAVLGARFVLVWPSLAAVAVALPFLGLNCTAQVAAMVARRPALSLICALTQLAAFWSLGPYLTLRWGSTGCAMAYAAAQVASSAVSAVVLRRVLDVSLVRWGLTVVLGLPLLALSGLARGPALSLALAAAAVAAYLGLLVATGVAPVRDLVGVWRGRGEEP